MSALFSGDVLSITIEEDPDRCCWLWRVSVPGKALAVGSAERRDVALDASREEALWLLLDTLRLLQGASRALPDAVSLFQDEIDAVNDWRETLK